jgi:hypothetical protein
MEVSRSLFEKKRIEKHEGDFVSRGGVFTSSIPCPVAPGASFVRHSHGDSVGALSVRLFFLCTVAAGNALDMRLCRM